MFASLPFPVASTGLEVILAGSLSGLSAQLIKFVATMFRHRRIDFHVLVSTGGMPSSHSATMSSMATSVGLVSGWLSVDFAIALGVALVVMYDAAGLRRAAGRMAGVLNHMMEEMYRNHPEMIPERLRELLGHTPFEVFVGALFGIVWSVVMHRCLAVPLFTT